MGWLVFGQANQGTRDEDGVEAVLSESLRRGKWEARSEVTKTRSE